MPIHVQAPNGDVVEFPDGTSDDVMASAMQQSYGQQASPPADQPDSPQVKAADAQLSELTQHPKPNLQDAKAARDQFYQSGIYAGKYNPLGPVAKSMDAFSSGALRAPLMGFDDEISAGVNTLGGFAGNYEAMRSKLDNEKAAQRAQNPTASLSGELAGGLAAGGTAANAGLTLAGRNLPVIGRTGGAVLEGMGYGGLYGAGEAKPGERTKGAAIGAALGGTVGGVASRVGDALASRAARNAANDAAPSAQQLNDASQALYDQAYQSGVAIEPTHAQRLFNNMRMAAGRPNENLRPQTAGLMDDINALQGQPIDLQRFHELRQEVDLAASRASPSDQRSLTRMRDVLNNFAENVTPQHVVGPADAFTTFRQADDLWSRRVKTQKIEDLFDLADVKSGRYSQSGMENAIRDKASQLYTRIVKRQERSFTPEETALIRTLARGNTSPALLKWVAKFAPRGVVSAGAGSALGATVGTTLGGPVGGAIGFAVPGAVGMGAARVVDRAAQNSLHALETAAATGNAPVLGAVQNRTVPFIGAAAGGLGDYANRPSPQPQPRPGGLVPAPKPQGQLSVLNNDYYKVEQPMTMAGSDVQGLVTPGNIDLAKRPVVKNKDGSISTVRSMSFDEDGKEILVPTVSPDGKILSEKQAIDLYHKTGQHLGIFDNPDDATAYAQSLHKQQDKMYSKKR